MNELRIGQTVERRDGHWKIVGYRGNLVRLENALTGDIELSGLTELVVELDIPPALQHGGLSLDGIIDEVSDRDLVRAQKLASDLDELIKANAEGRLLGSLIKD